MSPSLPWLGALAGGWLFFRSWQAARSSRIVRRLPITERRIWLTIDDGPDRRDTEGMLRALAEFGGQASFFLLGREVERRRALCHRLREAGHTVENHTYHHRSAYFWLLPQASVLAELQRASHALTVAAGERPRFYRAPVGWWSRAQLRACRELGLVPVGWSAGGGEGACCGDLLAAVERTVRQLEPGAIVLLHQGGRRGRVAALRLFLQRLHSQGWSLVSPAEVPALLPSEIPTTSFAEHA